MPLHCPSTGGGQMKSGRLLPARALKRRERRAPLPAVSPRWGTMRRSVCLLSILIATLAVPGVRAADAEEGFVSLFDGKTLKGWTRVDNRGPDYYVTNGVIVCPEESAGNLLTEKEYSDFVFRRAPGYEFA